MSDGSKLALIITPPAQLDAKRARTAQLQTQVDSLLLEGVVARESAAPPPAVDVKSEEFHSLTVRGRRSRELLI